MRERPKAKIKQVSESSDAAVVRKPTKRAPPARQKTEETQEEELVRLLDKH